MPDRTADKLAHSDGHAVITVADKLFPIPLGAFLVSNPAEPWTIDLNTKAIGNMPRFSPNDWPSKVERGWIEYVHVRYGRAAIGGVQQKDDSE